MAIAISSAVIGLILIIMGAIKKSEWVEVNVVGLSESLKYRGSLQNLDSLLQIIREKQTAKSAISETRIPVIDIVKVIRKLADLRDEGIITEEEFQEKKGKLLRNSS